MIHIRKIASSDTEPVKELVSDIMQNEFSAENKVYSFHDLDNPIRYYNGKKDIFLVAEKDGEIIGTVAIKEDSTDTALLRRVFVRKNFRGKGYGEKLVKEAVTFCFAHKYNTITFRGTNRMQQALNLCLKQGFAEDDIVVASDLKMFVLTKKLQSSAKESESADSV